MPQDFAPRTPSRGRPNALWFLFILLSSLMLGSLFYLRWQNQNLDDDNATLPPSEALYAAPAQAPVDEPAPVVTLSEPVNAATPPRFDFYQLLSEAESEVQSNADASVLNNLKSGYLVEMGHFDSPLALEKQKAQLALRGFEPQVLALNAQKSRFRLVLGPFETEEVAQQMSKALVASGFREHLVVQYGSPN